MNVLKARRGIPGGRVTESYEVVNPGIMELNYELFYIMEIELLSNIYYDEGEFLYVSCECC